MLSDVMLGIAYVSVQKDSSVSTSLIISTWVLGFTFNAFVTGAIVTHLRKMGQTIASLTGTSTNRFASSIYLMVESGGIAAVVGVGVLALFASNSPATSSGLDVVCQLVVWVHPSFLLLRALSCFVSAGIDATLDRRPGWENWSISI